MQNKFQSLIKKLRKAGFNVKSKKRGNIDPVCDMEATDDFFEFKYQGKTYYFCSEFCREKFVKNPENYAK